MAFVGWISFMDPGSFQTVLVILYLFFEGVWNQIGIILYVLRWRHPSSKRCNMLHSLSGWQPPSESNSESMFSRVIGRRS